MPSDLFLMVNEAAEREGLMLNTWMLLAVFRLISDEEGELDDVQG